MSAKTVAQVTQIDMSDLKPGHKAVVIRAINGWIPSPVGTELVLRSDYEAEHTRAERSEAALRAILHECDEAKRLMIEVELWDHALKGVPEAPVQKLIELIAASAWAIVEG